MGGLFGGGGLSGDQKRQIQAQTALAQQLGGISGQAANLGGAYAGMSTPALGQAMDYWSKLLSGDRTAMAQTLGPEVQQISQGQQNALTNVSQFTPRSGARATTMAQLPFQQARDVGNLYASVRPAAAQNLGNLGVGTGQLATGAYGAATGAGSSGGSLYTQMLQAEQAARQMQNQNQQAAGQAMFELLMMAAMACWCAEALWGTDDRRTLLTRVWLNTEFKRSIVGRVTMRAYVKWGRTVASWIKHYTLIREAMRFPFNLALARAEAWERSL